MKRVLVLCHGNVNRSPLCAKVLQMAGVDVKSAGFRSGGQRAAKKTREYAFKKGINIEFHRSSVVSPEMYDWAELVIYMDEGNRKRLLAFEELHDLVAERRKPSRCLGQWANPVITRIPDPGFMPLSDPRLYPTLDLVIDASRRLAKMIANGSV